MPQETTPPPTARIAIYGSCVSRDTLSTMDPSAYGVVTYIARQSLLSAGWDASTHLPTDFAVSSNFQRRNIDADIRGGLLSALPSPAAADLLVWDLVDERHGVFVFPDGSVVTRSIDLLMVEALKEATASARYLPFGSDEHFTRWSGAASMFVHALHTLGWGGRILVVAVPWATHDDTGEPTPSSMGISAKDANAAYARYYAHVDALGLPLLRVSTADAVAATKHRWGIAPFHYAPEVYEQINEGIAAHLG